MKLVVVESPKKIKKIKSYLGDGFDVVATVGHFCDLPERELSVDMDFVSRIGLSASLSSALPHETYATYACSVASRRLASEPFLNAKEWGM